MGMSAIESQFAQGELENSLDVAYEVDFAAGLDDAEVEVFAPADVVAEGLRHAIDALAAIFSKCDFPLMLREKIVKRFFIVARSHELYGDDPHSVAVQIYDLGLRHYFGSRRLRSEIEKPFLGLIYATGGGMAESIAPTLTEAAKIHMCTRQAISTPACRVRDALGLPPNQYSKSDAARAEYARVQREGHWAKRDAVTTFFGILKTHEPTKKTNI
jgi:hypothetical protein